jgi:hypothetical protein
MQIAAQSLLIIQNPLGSSPLIFPVMECFHIAGFILTVGTIALVDFRLLNWGMLHQTPEELARDTSLWTLGGLILVIGSGLLLFSGDPDQYYTSASFLFKMPCLVLAVVFHYTVHRKIVFSGASPYKCRAVAYISLGSWAVVIFSAIFIAFGPAI